MTNSHIEAAQRALVTIGMPKAQHNERTALVLLALLGLTPEKAWAEAEAPLVGITPAMDFAARHYGRHYAPNTRETFRRQSMHQLVQAGIARYNPDEPGRSVNSPKAVYQIAPEALLLLRTYGTEEWAAQVGEFLVQTPTLAARYANERSEKKVALVWGAGQRIDLSPGPHSSLIKAIVEEFSPRFVPGATLLYVGDTGSKWAFYDEAGFEALGIRLEAHGKMPDVAIYYPDKAWLVLAEAVTSHGPVDAKRHAELAALFGGANAGLVFLTAFPTRAEMGRYLPAISWETEVWVQEAPSHLIHFNGDRFLGPHRGR